MENGWREFRLKHVIRNNPTKAEVVGRSEDMPVSFVPMDAVGEYGGLDLSREKSFGEVSSGYTYFRNGDVVVAKITPCFENGKGALATGLRSGIAFGTTELHVLRPQAGLDARFLFYLTISDRFRKLGEASMYGAGGQKRISEEFVEGYRAAIPPIDDQQAIASFLDREAARIDTLIEKKRRLLDLLEEKSTALITRAVTKGLDPDGPRKDSGVEWIGEIPEHWDVAKIKHVARMESGHTPHRGTPEYWADGVGWVSLADSKRLKVQDVITETEYEISLEGIANSSARLLPQGTVAFSRDATVGLCALLGRKMAVSQHFIAWVCSERIKPRYLLLVLKSMTQELDRLTMGATIGTLGLPEVSTLQTPLPPPEEQVAIVDYCERETAQLGTLRTKTERAIELLREYRNGLISAAVTGQKNP